MRTRWKHWSCTNCKRRPGPLEGCADGFPDLCDQCWVVARDLGARLSDAFLGWLR